MLTELIRLPLSKLQIKKLASGGAIRLSHAHLSTGGDVAVVLDISTVKRILSAINRGKGLQIKLTEEELQATLDQEEKTGGGLFGSVLGLLGGGIVGDAITGTARLASRGAIGGAKMMLKPLQSLADAVIQHQGERLVGALVPNLPQGFLPVKKSSRRGQGLYAAGTHP